MPNYIHIKNLCILGNHGVFQEEKRLGQKFFLDISCLVSFHLSDVNDDYSNVVCYAGICQLAQEVSDSGSFNLIETFADKTATAVLQNNPLVEEVNVTVRKPEAPVKAVVDWVAVEIVKHRRDP